MNTRVRARVRARGNGFQLFGSNTQQEEQQISNKLSASILQACAQNH